MHWKLFALMGGLAVAVTIMLLLGYGTPAKDEIKIGFIGPLTGDYAIIGVENLRGIELAVDEINSMGGIDGKIVRVIVEDDELSIPRTISAFEKLTSADGISFVFTVSYGGFISTAPLADQKKVVLIESLDTSKEIADAGREYAFGIGVYDEAIGEMLSEYAYANLGKEAGIIYNNNEAFMLLTKNSFHERFEHLGGSVEVQEYSTDTKDFRAHIAKIRAANPDMVVILGFDEAGFVARQIREMGISIPLLSIDTTLSEGFRKNAGEAYEGIYFTSWESEDKKAEQEFIESYQNKYGEKPQQILFVVTGYDAMKAMAKSMEDSGFSTEQVKENLYALLDFEGISGNLTMGEDGIVRTIVEKMYRIEDGKPVRI